MENILNKEAVKRVKNKLDEKINLMNIIKKLEQLF